MTIATSFEASLFIKESACPLIIHEIHNLKITRRILSELYSSIYVLMWFSFEN